MRRLKVYGGNLDGRHRVIAAATSKRAFSRSTGVQSAYCSETGNQTEVALALSEPGVVFAKPYRGGEYVRIGNLPPAEIFRAVRDVFGCAHPLGVGQCGRIACEAHPPSASPAPTPKD